MKKYISSSLGVIILAGFLYFQFAQTKFKKKIDGNRKDDLIGLKVSLKSLKLLKNGFNSIRHVDSSTSKILIFTNVECSQCEHLIKILNESFKC